MKIILELLIHKIFYIYYCVLGVIITEFENSKLCDLLQTNNLLLLNANQTKLTKYCCCYILLIIY